MQVGTRQAALNEIDFTMFFSIFLFIFSYFTLSFYKTVNTVIMSLFLMCFTFCRVFSIPCTCIVILISFWTCVCMKVSVNVGKRFGNTPYPIDVSYDTRRKCTRSILRNEWHNYIWLTYNNWLQLKCSRGKSENFILTII